MLWLLPLSLGLSQTPALVLGRVSWVQCMHGLLELELELEHGVVVVVRFERECVCRVDCQW